jgi:uncharacterized protein (AIM24 family)
VALHSHGGTIDLPVSPDHPVTVDANWMSGFLSAAMGQMLGMNSGEERQFDFTGAGTVLMQSSELATEDAHLVRQLQSRVGGLTVAGLRELQRTSQRLAAEQQ